VAPLPTAGAKKQNEAGAEKNCKKKKGKNE
jgi:hypothetical protein